MWDDILGPPPDRPVQCLADGPVAFIALNRPQRLNAVNHALVDALCEALSQADADDARVVVLCGRGRAFCAGHDLKDDTPASPEEARRHTDRLQDVMRLVRRIEAPVIASVHGYALGAGCEFALCSDLVIAANDAAFGFPEMSVGLTVTGGISHVLPRAVGLTRAKELLFLGERFSAQTANELNLVNRVVAAAELVTESRRLADTLARRPRTALALAKSVLNQGAQTDLDAALQTEAEHASWALGSTEAAAAAEAFRSKGLP